MHPVIELVYGKEEKNEFIRFHSNENRRCGYGFDRDWRSFGANGADECILSSAWKNFKGEKLFSADLERK
jgi:hypothetical protein